MVGFFSENKGSSLIATGSVYLLGTGTTLKLVELAMQGLEPPVWIMRGLAMAMLAGFPVVMYRTWRGDYEAEDHDSEALDDRPRKRREPPPEGSIAVLPFVNMSSDEEQEFFSDGLTEELLNLLAKIPELQVASRTSAFSFKGESVDIPTVAQRLNVGHVLEGSVRKAGSRVRITAQLIRAAEDVHTWSETYSRELDDIFAIQDEIATAVVDALKINLLGIAPPAVAETNPEVYAMYLKGMHLYRQLDSDGLAQAEGILKQAVAGDPGYGPAWNVLGMVLYRRAGIGDVPLEEGFAEAREAFQRELALDPNSAGAHAGLGWIALSHDRDFAVAARHYQNALALQPGNGEVLCDAAMLAMSLDRIDVAVALGERAVLIDPVNLRAHRYLGAAYNLAGEPARAVECLQQALELGGNYVSGQYHLGRALLAQGEARAATAAMEQESHTAFRLTGLALAYHALGRDDESNTALNELRSDWSEGGACQLAEVHAFRGEADAAFTWLHTAREQNDPGVFQLRLNPIFATLHDDPRWRELLDQLGLADEQLSVISFEVLEDPPSNVQATAVGT